jgi:hypothetical protein
MLMASWCIPGPGVLNSIRISMRSALWVYWVVATGLGATACGGSTSGSATSDAGGSTSDAGGSTGSCPTPQGCIVAPASQGSASIHLGNAETAGVSCGPGVHWVNAPTSFISTDLTTGQGRPRDIVVDGEQERHFACVVRASGDKFVVSASMNVPAFDKDHNPLQIPTRIQLATTIGKDESGASGSLVVADNEMAGAAYQSQACLYSVKADLTQDRNLAIDKGKAWGSVTCPSLRDPKDPASSCVVDIGYFILENCDQ